MSVLNAKLVDSLRRLRMTNEDTNSAADKKKRKQSICQKTGKCPFCPTHDRENRGRRVRSDKYKNKDRRKPDVDSSVPA